MVVVAGCATHTPDPKPDVYRIHPKSGKPFNVSQSDRDMAEAEKVLATLPRSLRSKTPEQLIESFNNPDGVTTAEYPKGPRYFIVRDGNKMIEAELRRRGLQAKLAMEQHRDDPTCIFTGDNGPPVTVGDLCAEILAGGKPMQF